GGAVWPGGAGAGPRLLFRLRPRPGEARPHQGVPRLAVRRVRRDAREPWGRPRGQDGHLRRRPPSLGADRIDPVPTPGVAAAAGPACAEDREPREPTGSMAARRCKLAPKTPRSPKPRGLTRSTLTPRPSRAPSP